MSQICAKSYLWISSILPQRICGRYHQVCNACYVSLLKLVNPLDVTSTTYMPRKLHVYSIMGLYRGRKLSVSCGKSCKFFYENKPGIHYRHCDTVTLRDVPHNSYQLFSHRKHYLPSTEDCLVCSFQHTVSILTKPFRPPSTAAPASTITTAMKQVVNRQEERMNSTDLQAWDIWPLHSQRVGPDREMGW